MEVKHVSIKSTYKTRAILEAGLEYAMGLNGGAVAVVELLFVRFSSELEHSTTLEQASFPTVRSIRIRIAVKPDSP